MNFLETAKRMANFLENNSILKSEKIVYGPVDVNASLLAFMVEVSTLFKLVSA
jgi:hypothetical protein